jgi:hypothetical protein
MEIKFTVDADRLNTALGIVSTVSPQVTPQGVGGYLFVVRGDQCRVYSKNSGYSARSSFPISDVSGEGEFMYPAEYVKAFEFFSGPITFTATADGDVFKVKYTHGGSGVAQRVSFDPRAVMPFEKELEVAQSTVKPLEFSIKILQLAFNTVKSFMAGKSGDSVEEVHRTLRIFGDANPELAKKANGFLYAANGKEACYFYCGAFLGRDLSAPAQHLPTIESFLSKCTGTVRVYPTAKSTYVFNSNNDVLGWSNYEVQYTNFAYLAKTDEIVVKISAKSMLYQLQYIRAELPKDKPSARVRLYFDPPTKTFWVAGTDDTNTFKSLPVEAQASESKVTAEVVANANVDRLIHIFEGIRGDTVEFRIRIVAAEETKRGKEYHMFRTIDEFLLNDEGSVLAFLDPVPEGYHVCRVTRYAPGLD